MRFDRPRGAAREDDHQEAGNLGGRRRREGGGGEEEKHSWNGNRSSSPCPMRPGDVFTVALDIRPLEDYEKSGVGHLGKVNRTNQLTKRPFTCILST